MINPIRTLSTIEYFPDGRPWQETLLARPDCDAVETAIRRMDNHWYPIVVLSKLDVDAATEDENGFHIIGGNGRYALFEHMGGWQYANPTGSEADAELWSSDQGYFCQEKNIADLALTLRLARIFFETGSYEALDQFLNHFFSSPGESP
ncbi:MAG: hypothetical protein Q4G70_06655 [Pseudomonadota bacterium]|nr:hypothetical protein [Pseudomonadota bacterium]